MEHQLDGVKVRRILRQVAQTCFNSPDRLLDTSNLVERHVVGHHDVATLERRGQTLLYVSQAASPFMAPLISMGATMRV